MMKAFNDCKLPCPVRNSEVGTIDKCQFDDTLSGHQKYCATSQCGVNPRGPMKWSNSAKRVERGQASGDIDAAISRAYRVGAKSLGFVGECGRSGREHGESAEYVRLCGTTHHFMGDD